jgi:hypothetical protein
MAQQYFYCTNCHFGTKSRECPSCDQPLIQPFYCVYCDANICVGPDTCHWRKTVRIREYPDGETLSYDVWHRALPSPCGFMAPRPDYKPGYHERWLEAQRKDRLAREGRTLQE